MVWARLPDGQSPASTEPQFLPCSGLHFVECSKGMKPKHQAWNLDQCQELPDKFHGLFHEQGLL